MSRQTPVECPRELKCQPLHCVMADDASSYVCCGLIRFESDDPYRLCFVTPKTDSCYDHDELDLLDIVEVITRGLSTRLRLRAV